MPTLNEVAADGLVYLTCPRPGCGATLRVKPKKARSWVTCAAPDCGHRFVLNVSDLAPSSNDKAEAFDFSSTPRADKRRPEPTPSRETNRNSSIEPRPTGGAGFWTRTRIAAIGGAAGLTVMSGLLIASCLVRPRAEQPTPQSATEVARNPELTSRPNPETDRDADPSSRAGVPKPAVEPKKAVVPPAVNQAKEAVRPTPPTESGPAQRRAAPTDVAKAPVGDVVARVRKVTALIEGKGGVGSGFLIQPGILVTNAHVINDELLDDVKVRFVTIEQAIPRRLSPVLLYKNIDRDLAIFRVESQSNPLELAEPGTNLDGLPIVVVGNPKIGDGPNGAVMGIGRATFGTLKAPAEWKRDVYFELHAESAPGNSGGPVVDAKTGRVVGVLTGGNGKTSLCIPFEEIVVALNRIAALNKAGTGNKHAAARHYLDYIETHMPLVERFGRQCMDLRLEQLRREAGSRPVDGSGRSSPVERIDPGKFDFKSVFESVQQVYGTYHRSNGEIPFALRQATAVRLEACAQMFSLARARTETERSFLKSMEQRRSNSSAAARTFDIELKKYRDAVETRYQSGN